MDRKKTNEKKHKTKKMTRITVELKKEIVEKYEDGMRIRDLTTAYRLPRTTISTIVKNKDIIKSANVAKGVKSISKQRSETLEHVEKLLLLWITERQRGGDNVTEPIICEKAKMIHADLIKNQAGRSQDEVFKASHGWFANFKKRAGIHGVARHGKGTDKVAADKFVKQFGDFVESERFIPHHVFNCDGTGLFWKKMPNRTYIGQKEKSSPGQKSMKGHNEELTTEELQQLQENEHQTRMDTHLSDSVEEEIKEASSSLIEEIIAKWMDVKHFSEKYHPDKAQTIRNNIVLEDQTMSHFRNILRRRQKQSTSDDFLIKFEPAEPSEEQQKTEKEEIPECQVSLQEDSSTD